MLNAQNSSEHLDIWLTNKNQRELAAKHILFLNLQEHQFGQISLEYLSVNGDLKKSQDPNNTQKYNFNAEGFTDISKVKAYGNFVFSKQFNNQIANDLRGKHDKFNPFYFYASHPNNKQNQQYLANTIFSYPIFKDKLTIGAGIDFDYNWSTTNMDPRADVVDYYINYKLQLAYRFKKHHLGIALGYGKTTQTNNIMYKNTQYKTSNQYKDRFLNISLGYGDIILSDQNYLLDRDQKTNTYKLAYAYWGNRLKVNSLAKVISQNQDALLNKYAETFNNKNTFKNKQINLETLLNYRVKAKLNLQLLVAYNNYKAENYRALEGINYRVNHFSLHTQFLTKLSDIAPNLHLEIGLDSYFQSTKKNDYAIGSSKNYSSTTNKLFINTLYKKSNHLYHFKLSPLIHRKLSNDLFIAPAQQNNFTQQVIWVDYLYHQKNKWALQTQLGYANTSWIKNYTVYLGLSANILMSKNQTRNSILASLKLYL